MKISLCMICRDEEKKIERCINSIKQVVDEIVVVDTGSVDKTVEIAKGLGARVFEIIWENDFAKAKNYAITQCTGDWIIFLDADEYFMLESVNGLRELVRQADKKQKDYILCEIFNEVDGNIRDSFKTVRIFKNTAEIRYKGRIHERIIRNQGELKGIDFIDKLKILHDGYSTASMREKHKVERNLTILLEEYAKSPLNSDICYYLMQSYNALNDVEKVWEYASKAIQYNNGEVEASKIMCYERLIHICRIKDKEQSVAESLYKEAVEADKVYPDFDLRYGEYLFSKQQYDESIIYFNLCLRKLELYTGTVLSCLKENLTHVLRPLSEAYLLEKRYQEVVPVLIKLLYINPLEVKDVYNLIKILEISESGETIGGFLSKLYDYSNISHQMLLIQISKKCGNQGLYNYILQYVDKQVKEKLGLEDKNL